MIHYIKNIGTSALTYANGILPGESYEFFDDSDWSYGVNIQDFKNSFDINDGINKDIVDGNVEYYQDAVLTSFDTFYELWSRISLGIGVVQDDFYLEDYVKPKKILIDNLEVNDNGNLIFSGNTLNTSSEFYSHTGNTNNPHETSFDNLSSTAHTHDWSDVNNTPTTVAGYGITDVYTDTEIDNNFLSGNTTVTDLGGYTTTEVDNNFLSGNTTVNDIGGYNISEVYNTGETYTSNQVDTLLGSKVSQTDFNTHTGDTTIHFTKSSININDLGDVNTSGVTTGQYLSYSGGTWVAVNDSTDLSNYYTITQVDDNFLSGNTTVTDLGGYTTTEIVNLLDDKTDLTLFNSHTGNTNNPHDTSFSNLASTAHTHILEDSLFGINNSQISNMQEVIDHLWSPGVSSSEGSDFILTKNLDNTVDVSSGTCVLRSTDTNVGELKGYNLDSVTGLTIIDGKTNYVIAKYNDGNPIITSTDDINDMIDVQTTATIYIITRIGDELNVVNFKDFANNFIYKNSLKDFKMDGIRHASGVVISDNGSMEFAVSSGEFFYVNQSLTSTLYNSNPDTFDYVYQDGLGGWTRVTGQTSIDNKNFDDGTGTLSALTSGYYSVNHIYILFDENTPHYKVVYGRGNYEALSEAQAIGICTTLPSELSYGSNAAFIGNIITKQDNDTTLVDILTPFNTVLSTSTPTNHNQLAGLQGGFNGEYYHITFDEYTAFIGHTGNTNNPHETTFDNLVNSAHTHLWSDITSTPTTISGYGITDVYTQTQVNSNFVSAITFNTYTGITAPNTYLPYTISEDTNFTTGILSRTESTISFNSGTTEFSILPTGLVFNYYLDGIKYSSTGMSITLSDQTGFADNQLWFIFIGGNGEIGTSQTPWVISSKACPMAILYWTGERYLLGEERHNAVRNLAWHTWAHETQGTQYKSGLDATFTTSDLNISSGVLEDEDIVLQIPSSTKLLISHIAPGNAAITFEKENSDVSAFVSGGTLIWDADGVMTPVQDTFYVKNYIYGTNNVETEVPCTLIVGQEEHGNINDARNATFPAFPTLISPETRLLYITIWKNVGGVAEFVESADFRTANTAPNGVLGKRPIYFDELEDVQATTPSIDDTLKYNGEIWITGPSSTVSVNAGGQSYFLSSDIILGDNTNNDNTVLTLEEVFTPSTTSAITGTVTTNTTFMSAFESPSGLGYTSIPAGTFSYQLYAGVSSTASGRVSSISIGTYSIDEIDSGITITTTGAGTTTAVATGGSPFTVDKIIGSTDPTVSSYLQTPQGLYQVTSRNSDTNITITTPVTYTGEVTTSTSIWKQFFIGNTGTITNISPNYGVYTINDNKSEYTILETTKIGSMFFAVGTDNNSTIVSIGYDSDEYSSYFLIPKDVRHNELTGINGGDGEFYWHLTNTQYSTLTSMGGVSDASLLHTHSSLYYTQTQLNNGQLDNRYYTETEVNNNFLSGNTTVTDLGGYTTTQIDNNFLSGNTIVGDVSGPTGSTDNALAKYDLTTGKLIQNSNAILDDDGTLHTSSFTNVTGTALTTLHIIEESEASTLRGILTGQHSNGGSASRLIGRKSQGTFALPTAITNTSGIFRFTASAHDGTNYVDDVARIEILASGTIGTGVIPTTINFRTTNSGGTLTNALNLTSLQTLEYITDVSTSYTDRSLIDKGYADATYITGTTGTGDVSGPTGSTDNAIARFDSTTGKIIQDSPNATLDDNGNLSITGNTLSRIQVGVPSYFGKIQITQNNVRIEADGTFNNFIQVNQTATRVGGTLIYEPGVGTDFNNRQIPDVDWINAQGFLTGSTSSAILSGGTISTTITTWTASGDTFYADFTHGVGSKDLGFNGYDITNNKVIGFDDIEFIDDDTVRLYITNDTIDVRVTVIGGAAASGEANTASNVGSGIGIYKQKTGSDLELRSLSGGTNVTITTGDTLTINATSVKPTLNRTMTLDAPTASDDITFFRTDVAITVQEVIAVSVGTTPSTTYVLRHGTDRNATGTLVTTSAASTSTTTGDIATLSDTTIPANSWVWLETSAASGTDVTLTIDIRYTED